jgi:hypothetical protein
MDSLAIFVDDPSGYRSDKTLGIVGWNPWLKMGKHEVFT